MKNKSNESERLQRGLAADMEAVEMVGPVQHYIIVYIMLYNTHYNTILYNARYNTVLSIC